MSINEFTYTFFGNREVFPSTVKIWYDDYKNSGLTYEKWYSLLKTRG